MSEPNTAAVIGMQWGDEGKGKIVDLVSEDFEVVVRAGGGANAGHSVVVGDSRYALHLIPSGAVRGKECVMGQGMVVEPNTLLDEIDGLRQQGVEISPENLMLDERATVIMPYHIALDGASLASKAIDTTKRGIGPAYADRIARKHIRMMDLLDEGMLRERLGKVLHEKNALLRLYGLPEYSEDDLVRACLALGEQLEPFFRDTRRLLRGWVDKGRSVLFEGAQGNLLDIWFGTDYYQTSSGTGIYGIMSSTGMNKNDFGRVIGVFKAYTTRVGAGPLPTEFSSYDEVNKDVLPRDDKGNFLPPVPLTEDEIAQAKAGDPTMLDKLIRRRGHEFGTTTGRPRRNGWPDLVIPRYAVLVQGIDEIAVTKLDVLDGLPMKVCTAYKTPPGERVDDWFVEGEPKYGIHFKWPDMKPEDRLRAVEEGWDALGENYKMMQDYLAFIAKHAGAPVSMASLGPERDMTVIGDLKERTSRYV